ncbi:HipA domain-containing protein [Aquincola sp. S2]|uniref:HipA domain-containing protein n=1 Tax=Pseudaquabacterium terrae TaxID=2732868 RepID=A0ABX2ECU5_9BURK|nr:HipA domain-containing protein [Aquabacterium terrae]NRF65672.1 HipA domain-containing protein [Aquabacterium terrae]
MDPLETDRLAVLAALAARGGVASSAQLQAALRKSQPTLSRLLAALSSQVLPLGRGRRARYGLARAMLGRAAQQPLWWIAEDGRPQRLGTLSLLGEGRTLHVDAGALDALQHDRLPWYLAPLRPQGFLGRLLAQRLAPAGLDANPERWTLEMQLFAALQLHDAPGAIVLGEPAPAEPLAHALPLPAEPALAVAQLDLLAEDVARTLPAGSSAGGEQPKFLVRAADGTALVVKFTPPRGTPFGERWHDLLHGEALAAAVLAGHGVEVAAARIVESSRRSYLLSPRFDRIGAAGRRHAVAVAAVHDGLVGGPYGGWAASCEALARQGRLTALDAARARALSDFGRLIGNTDMHGGNLSLFVERASTAGPHQALAHPGQALAYPAFTLAPVYDMLPMRWRPDVLVGGAADYSPFEPDPAAAAGPARGPARVFWQRLAAHAPVARPLRAVAAEMARRLG